MTAWSPTARFYPKRKNRVNIWNGRQIYALKNKNTVFALAKCRIFATLNPFGVKPLFFTCAFLLFCLSAIAQNKGEASDERMAYDGFIVAGDTLHPVRNTHVISKMAHYGTISNREGRFRIMAHKVDTLWVSCIGYGRQLIPVDSTLVGNDLVVRLHPDTVTLREVTILPFSNYETFKEMLITMPSVGTPDELKRLNDDLDEMWLSRKMNNGNGMVTVSASPIQFLYDKYNKSARRQAQLLRNRRMFNEVLREQGRTDELLPDSLDYPINYNVYQLDEERETGRKILVPKKKYFQIGTP